MNKEERVKLVFETISKIAGFEIEPEKAFYMVGSGVKGIYKIDESLNLKHKTSDGTYRMSVWSILLIFKGGYQLEEIKEPLLTEEEKEFLRQFKFAELEVSTHLNMYIKYDSLVTAIYLDTINLSFGGLKEGKKYSREELGL